MKFRKHTGSFDESMATCIDFYTQKELLDHIQMFQGEHIESIFSSRESVYDERCRWHTHNLMVKLANGEIYVAGQTNGYVEEFAVKNIRDATMFTVRESGLSVDADGIYVTPKLSILMPPSPIEPMPDYKFNMLPHEVYDMTSKTEAEFATNKILCVNCGSESYESDRRGHSWGLFTACKVCGHKHYWAEQDMMSGALYQFYLEAHGKDWPKEYYEYVK